MKRLLLGIFCLFLLCGCTAECGQIDVNYNDGIYHIVVDKSKIKKKIKVYASQELETNVNIHKSSRAELTFNAGYFDPKNAKSISYVISDRQTIEDPLTNRSLFDNPTLRKNMSKILNRTEFRIVDCDNKYKFDIVPHNTPIDFACSIVESVQGGPMILPDLKLEEEFFVVKDENGNVTRESCSVLHKVARTVIGIKDGNLHVLIITDEHPMDLYEVQELCKKLGFEKAMNLDGGSSTSMNYKNIYNVISLKGDGAGRKLKSFILVY
jgi:exopolysaccharide biosynthesis protein